MANVPYKTCVLLFISHAYQTHLQLTAHVLTDGKVSCTCTLYFIVLQKVPKVE